MIKLDIFPSFLNACFFKIVEQKEADSFIFHKNKSNLLENDEKTWSFNVSKSTTAELKNITDNIIANNRIDNRLILDGVNLKCTTISNEIIKTFDFKCPENDSLELKLVHKYLELGHEYIMDLSFINYIELLEGYFYNKIPIKIFDENPYRIKIYASMSYDKKEELSRLFSKISKNEEIIIDMTNFQGMGTLLYECFIPLFNVKNLRFMVNNIAFKQLMDIGFDTKKIELIK